MHKRELSLIIQLAITDNELAEKEEKLIFNLGTLHGIPDDEIRDLIKNPVPIGPVNALSDDEKFQYLYMVIQMMKIDGQIFKSEIEYCKSLAEKLGFKKTVVAELSSRIYSDPSITSDREELKRSAIKFLK
ncbi:MAG: TerB family tellurite resistance protein [Cyclobacteriaceae bacterium]|nr:TerB family tellurite resistance protein [Cyclobacteriaceae bacterium]